MSVVGPYTPSTVAGCIRVVVIAEVRLYREGLAAALAQFDRLHMAGVAGTAGDALQLVQDTTPDVAIIDISLAAGLGLLRELHGHGAATKAIAFGVDNDSAAIIRCAEAGAAGYVTLNASLEELMAAIERAAAGELVCEPRIAAELFRHVGGRSEFHAPYRPAADGLTPREHEVLGLIARGLSNKEIGSTLHIAEATVKNHVHHLLEKLQVTTRAQAAACAHDIQRHRRTSIPHRTTSAPAEI